MVFSRQEYWSGLTFHPPGNLPDPGIEPWSPVVSCIAGGYFTILANRKAPVGMSLRQIREVLKDREAWRAAVHGVVCKESDTSWRLNNS